MSTDNPRIVQAVKLIFKKNLEGDFWNDLAPEEKAEIEQGITELEQRKKQTMKVLWLSTDNDQKSCPLKNC